MSEGKKFSSQQGQHFVRERARFGEGTPNEAMGQPVSEANCLLAQVIKFESYSIALPDFSVATLTR